MASKSTLLKPLIKEILLKEIGEANISPLKFFQTGDFEYKFLVDIGDYTETVNVDFDMLGPEHKQFYLPPKYRNLGVVFNIGYNVSGVETQYAKSDLKTLLKILSTVVAIVQDFVSNNEPDGLFLQGTPKDLDSKDITQKSNLYSAFIKNSLDKIKGYKSDTYKDGFILISTDK